MAVIKKKDIQEHLGRELNFDSPDILKMMMFGLFEKYKRKIEDFKSLINYSYMAVMLSEEPYKILEGPNKDEKFDEIAMSLIIIGEHIEHDLVSRFILDLLDNIWLGDKTIYKNIENYSRSFKIHSEDLLFTVQILEGKEKNMVKKIKSQIGIPVIPPLLLEDYVTKIINEKPTIENLSSWVKTKYSATDKKAIYFACLVLGLIDPNTGSGPNDLEFIEDLELFISLGVNLIDDFGNLEKTSEVLLATILSYYFGDEEIGFDQIDNIDDIDGDGVEVIHVSTDGSVEELKELIYDITKKLNNEEKFNEEEFKKRFRELLEQSLIHQGINASIVTSIDT